MKEKCRATHELDLPICKSHFANRNFKLKKSNDDKRAAV